MSDENNVAGEVGTGTGTDGVTATDEKRQARDPSAGSVTLDAWVRWREGTVEDAAAFFGVTTRTLSRWTAGAVKPWVKKRRATDVTREDIARLTDGDVSADLWELPPSAVRVTAEKTIERFPGGLEFLSAERLIRRETGTKGAAS